MKKTLSVPLLATILIIIQSMSPVVQTVSSDSFLTYFDSFNGPTVFDDFSGKLTDRWTVYRGNPYVASEGGRSDVLVMNHPQSGGEFSNFGDAQSTSVYLTNPSTSAFTDGMLEFDIYFATSGEAGVSANIVFRMQDDSTYYVLHLTSTRDWKSYFAKYSAECGPPRWQIIGVESPPGVFPTGAWSHVTVTIGGPRFEACKDGLPICFAVDNMWGDTAFGGIGILNNYYNGVFYIDNFRIPGRFNWVVYRGSPGPESSQGRMAPSWLFEHPVETSDEGPFADIGAYSAYVSNPKTNSFVNGVISFDMLFPSDGGQKALLVFRMQSESTHYALRLTSTSDWPSARFEKIRGFGITEAIGTESGKGIFPVGVWKHVMVVINNCHFEAYVEDTEPIGSCNTCNPPTFPIGQNLKSKWTLITSADDSEWPAGCFGGIGFYSGYTKTVFRIDNLKICLACGAIPTDALKGYLNCHC
ncbi:MAG: hypothetical protein V1857_06365 [archaeon]